jgi:DNA modification methylase
MFPDELPRRLIKMFAFIGDTVLDPFLGSGTTVKVALEQKRNAVGCEINEEFLEIVILIFSPKFLIPFLFKHFTSRFYELMG